MKPDPYDIPVSAKPADADEHKCVVFGCTNHKHQGAFVGEFCMPCYTFIVTGKPKGPGTSFMYDVLARNKDLEQLNKELEDEVGLLASGKYLRAVQKCLAGAYALQRTFDDHGKRTDSTGKLGELWLDGCDEYASKEDWANYQHACNLLGDTSKSRRETIAQLFRHENEPAAPAAVKRANPVNDDVIRRAHVPVFDANVDSLVPSTETTTTPLFTGRREDYFKTLEERLKRLEDAETQRADTGQGHVVYAKMYQKVCEQRDKLVAACRRLVNLRHGTPTSEISGAIDDAVMLITEITHTSAWLISKKD